MATAKEFDVSHSWKRRNSQENPLSVTSHLWHSCDAETCKEQKTHLGRWFAPCFLRVFPSSKGQSPMILLSSLNLASSVLRPDKLPHWGWSRNHKTYLWWKWEVLKGITHY